VYKVIKFVYNWRIEIFWNVLCWSRP